MIKKTHRQNITLPEIFEMANAQETQEDKIEFLKLYKNLKHMRWIVNVAYNYDFSGFEIPSYEPNRNPPGLCQGINNNLNRLISAIKLHEKGNLDRYNDLMTLVLSSVSRDEALLIEKIFNNKKIDGISKSTWKKVYPEFFRD